MRGTSGRAPVMTASRQAKPPSWNPAALCQAAWYWATWWSPLKIKCPCLCKHGTINLIVWVGLQSIKRCRCADCLPTSKVNQPSLVSLKQHLFSHENIYEITSLKWITCVLLSRTKMRNLIIHRVLVDVLFFFSPCSMWKVWINLCNRHHFDSETSHHF